jgi:hypothetical protein
VEDVFHQTPNLEMDELRDLRGILVSNFASRAAIALLLLLFRVFQQSDPQMFGALLVSSRRLGGWSCKSCKGRMKAVPLFQLLSKLQ